MSSLNAGPICDGLGESAHCCPWHGLAAELLCEGFCSLMVGIVSVTLTSSHTNMRVGEREDPCNSSNPCPVLCHTLGGLHHAEGAQPGPTPNILKTTLVLLCSPLSCGPTVREPSTPQEEGAEFAQITMPAWSILKKEQMGREDLVTKKTPNSQLSPGSHWNQRKDSHWIYQGVKQCHAVKLFF